MDLTFSRFEHVGAADFAVLMAIATARQGGSPSARRHATLDRRAPPTAGLLTPPAGSFHAAVAAALRLRAEE